MASSIGAAGGGGIFKLPSISSLDGAGSGAGVGAGSNTAAVTDSKGSSFADLLSNKVEGINAKQNEASGLMEDLATGKTDDVAQTMMRIQEANLDLKLATQVRNKVIDAYQEVLRMQV
jgi:flagellar hook-basal body complex protein FliE